MPSSRVLSRLPRRLVRAVVLVLVMALPVSLIPPVSGTAFAGPGRDRPAVRQDRTPVKGRPGKVRPRKPDPAAKAAVRSVRKATWPKVASADVPVRTAAGGRTEVGGLLVSVTAPRTPKARAAARQGQETATGSARPDKVRVEVLDPRSTGAARVVGDRGGVLLRISRTDGRQGKADVGLAVDYSSFASAFGGNYGAHLRLVRLPACALTTPSAAACQTPVPVKSVNDAVSRTVTADISLDSPVRPASPGAASTSAAAAGGTVVALAAAEGSGQGDYGATDLSPSSKWSVAPSSGAFSWSYSMRTPPVPGGLAVPIGLNYSSQSVDGRTAATNNQGSWIGEGFSYAPGYIERRYKACADDGHKTVGDLCWGTDNAVIQLGGKSTDLIKDGSTGQWRLKDDDGSKVEKLTGANNDANNGEYWRITTADGTQYYFGLHRLPGWSTGKTVTNSAWTVPVFGDDSGEPCYKATFADASCNQAWRWNLDYVKDRHDNVLSYFYEREVNHYARNAKTDVNGTEYHRGGYLREAQYGQKDGQVFTTPASARILYTTAERCIPSGSVTCSETATPDSANWPDVPGWLHCKPSTKCNWQQTGPSFWTRKRLTKITTQIRSGSGYSDVDSWTLKQDFTDNGDGSQTLWLSKIDHAGHVGGTAAMPTVELRGAQMPNRVDVPNDNIQPMVRFRLATVYTDTGGQVDVNYAPTECTASALPTPGNSTKRCFPVKWSPPGAQDPITDWFHKYVVERVIETDRTGGSPDQVTKYTYLGDAGWRHSDPDGITDTKYQTWGEWAGYENVQVRGGDGLTFTTRTDHTYLRGLHGDQKPGGGTRTVSVPDSTGGSYTDHADLAGFELETITYNGTRIVDKSITTPWRHQTASRTNSWGTDRAGFVRPEVVRNLVALSSGDYRETKAVTSFDGTTGRVTQVDDLGDVDVASDDKCTRSYYADNVGAWMRSLVKQVETYTAKCSGPLDKATKLISDTRTYYDGQALGVAPTKGDATKVETLKSHDGTDGVYIIKAEGTFDGYGRPLVIKDTDGSATTTVYTDTNGFATGKKETSPLGHVTETSYAPAWGQPIAQVDPNGKRSDLEYDALGRVTRVWMPDRSKAAGLTPSIKYSYLVRRDDVVAVKTEKVDNDGGYGAEYKLYDGFLRPRQVQTEGPGGGRLVADTFYNSTGQIAKANATYYAAGAPTDTVLTVANGDVDGQTVTTYDGAGRPSAEIFQVAGDEKWRTTTTYDGDRTHVDPPAGGTPTTLIVDAQGRKTSLLQYKGDGPSGPADTTTYTYAPAGQLESVTDPAGNVWRYEYDRRGRKTKAIDPDAGTSTYRYDDFDRRTHTTDARGVTLFTAYDKIGRKTGLFEGENTSGTKLAAWTYDTKHKGHLYAAVRYVDGNTAKPYGTVFLYRDDLYRPTTTRYVVPDTEGGLGGTYDYTTVFNRDGTTQSVGTPAAGGLPAETVSYGYDSLQRPTTVDGIDSYVTRTQYSDISQVLQQELTTGAKKTWLTYSYERGTGRLTQATVDRQTVGAADFKARYGYDDAGNVTSINDVATGDNQCFAYDHLRRTTQAWTGAADCATTPTAANIGSAVGGPEPYWQSFDYDATGNRKQVVQHALAAGQQDTTSISTYPAAGQARPHGVIKSVDSTPQGDRLNAFAYDAAGNTTERSLAGSDQKLTWNSEGRLDTVTGPGQLKSSHVYDTDGNRLIRKENGVATLYLPGMELRLNQATGTVEGTRYYTHGGSVIATRTKDGVTFLAADHHGTALLAVKNDDAQTLTRRRLDLFGGPRAGRQQPAWIDDKGFLGKPKDASGLTHIGAREYDPTLGRFISVDPVIDVADPQQMNGYAYANNSPASSSDPDGLCPVDKCGAIPGHNRPIGYKPTTPTEICGSDLDCRAAYSPGGSRYRGPGGGGSAGKGSDQAAAIAAARAAAARQRAEQAKQRLVNAAKALGKIAADELGITDALDCFTKGDFEGCASTAITVAGSFVGGMLSKLTLKYGAPWRWPAGAKLAKRVKDLLGDLIGGIQDWWKARKCNSFTSSTRVLMANGRKRPIGEIKVGDRVLATDLVTRKTRPQAVSATIVGQGYKRLVEVTIDTDGERGDRLGRVVATDGHPFWATVSSTPPWKSMRASAWVKAADLAPGMWLRTSAGVYVQITAIKIWAQRENVHNLTVEADHTYYVEAGDAPVLVHNCDWAAYGDNSLEAKYDKHVYGMDDDGKLTRKPDMPEYQDDGFDGMDRMDADAKALMCPDACPVGAVEHVRNSDGVLIRFDTTTGRLGMRDGNIITTFFRPSDGIEYFNREARR